MAQISQQTIRHVNHGVYSSLSRHPSLTVGNLGTTLGSHNGTWRTETASEKGQSGSCQTELANHRNFIAGYSTVTTHRCHASGLSDNCYGDADNRATRGVPTDDADSCLLGLGGHPGHEFAGPGRRKITGSGKPDDEGYWYGAHCLDVGNVDGDGLSAHVGRRRPSTPEVNLLDEDVGRDNCGTVYLEHRAIVSRAEGDSLAHRQVADHRGDEGKLPYLGNGRRGGHGISLSTGHRR